ncbi:MAG: hypothetical protein IPH35_20365 [Rhodoferax sp.]|nr:hypothetical protein [Rhodoferax sp.]
MNAVVIEHVRVSELPASWQEKFQGTVFALRERVTVRIEEETIDGVELTDVSAVTANPIFGMWHDHKDLVDVNGYVQELRRPRFTLDCVPHAD